MDVINGLDCIQNRISNVSRFLRMTFQFVEFVRGRYSGLKRSLFAKWAFRFQNVYSLLRMETKELKNVEYSAFKRELKLTLQVQQD